MFTLLKQPKKQACGCIFISTKTERILLNLRSETKSHKLTWGFWGGMMEPSETSRECLEREIKEEMGINNYEKYKIYPFDIYQSYDGHFRYISFICLVENEFVPKLNLESSGYCWVDIGCWPKPLHQGAAKTLSAQHFNIRIDSFLKHFKPE